MVKGPNRYERLIERVQNHRWLAPLLVVGIALIALANVTEAGTRLASYLRPDAELELTSADELSSGVLDVTVRNLSSDDAVVTSLDATVDSLGHCFAREMPISANFVIPVPYAEGSVGHIPVRQSIAPHSADRFTIALRPAAVCMKVSFRWHYNHGRVLTLSHAFR